MPRDSRKLSRADLARLRRKADILARKPYKSSGDRAREAEINARFERDMRARDGVRAPWER